MRKRALTTAATDAPVTDRGGRLVTALGVAQICSWGSLYYSFPLVAEAMRTDLGWSKPELYGAPAVGIALAGIAAYPVGAAIDRGHGRAVMSLASVAAGLLMFAWARVSGVLVFYAIFAAIGCLYAATLYDPAFAVITRRFGAAHARRGITALTLWGGFASTVFVPLVELLISRLGWRGALSALGVINIAVCAVLYFAAIDPAKDRYASQHHPSGAAPLAGWNAVIWAARKPVFWALVTTLVAYAASFSALTFHLYPLLLERGLAPSAVVTVMACIGPAQVAGRVFVWTFARDASIRTVGSIIVVVFPLSVLGFAYAPPQVAAVGLVAVMFGIANGVMTIVRGLAVPEMLRGEAYGSINGALVAPMNVMQALSPLAAAAIWSATGGYATVLLVILAGAVVLAVSFWTATLLSRDR